MTYFRELWASRELLLNLTMREITGRYKRTVLGQLWSLLNPLASMLVYTIVFGIIFRSDPGPGDPSGLDVFALWLLCGLLPFQFFQNAVNGGMGAIWANTALVKKVYFPRTNLVLAASFSAAFNWSIEMLILAAAVLVAGAFVLPFLPLVVVFMVLLVIMSTGIGLILAVVNVYFQDMQHIIGIALRLLMYLSPVVYPVSYVADRSANFGPIVGDITLLQIYELNPLERFISVFRQLLYDNRLPDMSDTLWCLAWTIVFAVVGILVFKANEKKLAEML
ncbi:ABC transporter permease [Frigoribacterium sp. CFBP9039]|uniref:ABC transporter permease n=1 Tax=unclassified Frigoribacterium TaxID=2627005 RepID=UPI001781CC43|nr:MULTISPECIES: ABC transporter permease [unclassified Frigoribacterium]MBD8702471.1 ABC transporter permease [Frigoribacterium sp. CFBP 13712]MDY0891243.1 ABC transporter permease [Frigoribacterium sp. CFBP9030]MDY0944456.1 ABC transporter permease [Frigoribacterium sp. CFBP9039]